MRKEVKPGSTEFQSFADVFELYKELGTVEESDTYWDEAVDKVNAYLASHPDPVGQNFGRALMCTLFDESEPNWASRMSSFLACRSMNDKEVARAFVMQAQRVARKWFGGEVNGQ